jgi:hypothetical protein
MLEKDLRTDDLEVLEVFTNVHPEVLGHPPCWDKRGVLPATRFLRAC